MNHREPPHLSAAARRALHCLSLLLLPALAPEGALAVVGVRSGRSGSGEPVPYLPALGAPPLRFEEPMPPPDLVTRPAAGAPPTPALTPAESSVAIANAAAAHPAPVPPPPVEAPVPTAAPEPKPVVKEPAPAPVPPAKTPPPILPDDSRPAIRPEDFLPYFQIPGAAKRPGDVMLLTPGAPSAPTPPPIPPSSATYTQTPK